MAYDTEDVTSSADWLQGDIVKRQSDTSDAPFLAIISADCDIVQGKTGPSGLACLEVWPLAHFLVHEHAPTLAHKELNGFLERLAIRINDHRMAADAAAQHMGVEAIREWLSHETAVNIVASLTITQAPSAGLTRDIHAASDALEALRANAQTWPFNVIRLVRNRPTLIQAAEYVFNALPPRKLPLDLFFVSEIPYEHELGYVVHLRRLAFVPLARLQRSPVEARMTPEAYLRVGRLKATFRHGLAQQFANLFARIGYPEDFENDRDERFQLCIHSLTEAMVQP